MAHINILSEEVAQLIAAGEVVERPSSVIKELIENSIDAGSSQITAEIKNGGSLYMRITDNGTGITREDLPKAFLRHATSKVALQSDLDAISTLGFRGEALASIAAVSKVELLSRHASAENGTRIELHGGREIAFDEAGCPKGTTIVIRDLFYNTPARRKFLKKDATEAAGVTSVIENAALSHPEVAFKLIKDSKLAIITPGDGNLFNTINSIYGSDFSNTLLPLNYASEAVAVSGFITKPMESRTNRTMQFFFLNGRYIKSKTLFAALEQGYKNSIMTGKFPGCVINITIDPRLVDINVHPAKTEVRFQNDHAVFTAVFFAVKSALSSFFQPEAEREQSTKPTESKPIYTSPFAQNEAVPVQSKLSDNISAQPEEKADILQDNTMQGYDFVYNREAVAAAAFSENAKIPEHFSVEYDIISASDHYISGTATSPPKGEPVPMRDYSNACAYGTIATDQPTAGGAQLSELDANDITAAKQPLYSSAPSPRPVVATDADAPIYQHAASGSGRLTPPQYTVGFSPPDKPDLKESAFKADTGKALENSKIIGELFKTYVLIESEEVFYLVDKHAAHERIIFDKLKKDISFAGSQMLLSPVVVSLGSAMIEALNSNAETVRSFGFEIDDFGSSSIIVRSCPMILDINLISETISEIALSLSQSHADISVEKFDSLLHNIACRSAIKANDFSKPEELRELIALIGENKVTHCPHGRPVYIRFSKKELENKFGRI